VAVTVQDAAEGDRTTSIETLIDAAEQIEAVVPDGDGLHEVVADNRRSIDRIVVVHQESEGGLARDRGVELLDRLEFFRRLAGGFFRSQLLDGDFRSTVRLACAFHGLLREFVQVFGTEA
jgi:hypothetical protein